MPNTFSYLALCSWPFVTLFFFRRLPTAQAVFWTIMGGYLLLPPDAHWDPPILPDLNKITIPNLCAFVGVLAKREQAFSLPNSFWVRAALALYLTAPIGTALTNGEIIRFAAGGLPPMAITEIPSSILTNLTDILPLLLGYMLFRNNADMRGLLRALVLAGLLYSIPMLIEIRLSPQINVWVYGFFQHAFDQMMRYGGFRPIVFLPHGLWAAFFAFMAAFAAVTLLRNEEENRFRAFLFCLYLMVLVVLCKSANAVIYMVLFVPVVLLFSTKVQIRIATIIAAFVLFYPAIRGAGIVPVTAIADFASSLDVNRGGSLIFRLMNEDILLAHASEKPWFGWGGWARSLVHDFQTGELATTIDGRWIVTIGMSGWFGYLGEFGLLTLPIFLMVIVGRSRAASISRYAAAVALILAANLVDLIPNATLIPFTWLMAGALLGYAEFLGTAKATSVAIPSDTKSTAPWGRSQPTV